MYIVRFALSAHNFIVMSYDSNFLIKYSKCFVVIELSFLKKIHKYQSKILYILPILINIIFIDLVFHQKNKRQTLWDRSFIENSRFQNVIRLLDSRYLEFLPSRRTLTSSILPELFSTTKNKLQDILNKSSYISITSDIWTSFYAHSNNIISLH